MLQRFEKALHALEHRNRKRTLRTASGLDFASNDYLALSTAPQLRNALLEALERGVPVGAGASRLLRGNHPEHELLEADAAAFFQSEKALFFGGGYVANFALLTTLPQKGDLIVYDALIHASCHEGIRAGRAEAVASIHNDAESVENAIVRWRADGNTGRVWIVCESLYSMDGDRAPLADLAALATRYEAFLIIDEAHATGVFGPNGRGLAAGYHGHENIITMHTCGKALGAVGAVVCSPTVLHDFLVNRCRPFIYATAPSPLMAVAVREALSILQREPERIEQLHRLISLANTQLETKCGVRGSGSQILPVIVGSDAKALSLAAAMQARGFDIRGIRPPTVPEGTARLRLSVTLHVNESQIAAMLSALAEELNINQA